MSALQEQPASLRGTFEARVSALHAQSASAPIGVKLGLSTPQAIPAAATNFSNVIIFYFPAGSRASPHPPGRGSETMQLLAVPSYPKTANWGNVGKYLLGRLRPLETAERELAIGRGFRNLGPFGSERSSVW